MKCGLTHRWRPQSCQRLLAIGLVAALVGGLRHDQLRTSYGHRTLGLAAKRSGAASSHESSRWMLAPMAVLVVLCMTIAVVPQAAAGAFGGALGQVLGRETSQDFLDIFPSSVPLATIGAVNAWTVAALGIVAIVAVALSRQGARSEAPTWGCGYLMPSPRMQYTGRSFAEMMTEQLLPRFLRPETTRRAPLGLFPSRSDFRSACPDPMSEKVYEPFFRRSAERFSRLRVLQQGRVSVYLVYIVVTIILALAWVSIREYWGGAYERTAHSPGHDRRRAPSGLPGLFRLSRSSMSGQWATTAFAVLGAGLGLGGTGWFYMTGDSQPIVLLPSPGFSGRDL